MGWSNYSDGRFKRNVKEDVAGLDFIKRLRPVTYQWDIHALNRFLPGSEDDKTEWAGKYDIEQVKFSGFIAQEVEQAAQDVNYQFSGVDKPQNEHTPYALRYADFVVPLVKAVQEQQAIIDEGNKRIEALEASNAALQTQLANIAAALQSAGFPLEK
ncbi:MAG: tail fiber domain-containing protein [Saprospiraceae bacterium]|nr:tail fiber domain-containing protein [Saprospiraceae bacterium]